MSTRRFMEIGERFGRLVVVDNLLPKAQRGRCKVICECGKSFEVDNKSLKSGKTQSCGCLKLEKNLERSTKHDMSKTRFYRIWRHMKDRCDNPKTQYYSLYGGRGLTYDPRWKDFITFMDEMLPTYEDTLELDRIDPDKGYYKDNCRWVTESLQAYNQRVRKTNTSSKTGVYKKSCGKFWAEIQRDGKTEWLGTFKTFREAKKIREEKELEYYGFIKG